MPQREKGKLVYIMGPSGVGKDTLLRHLRPQCNPRHVVFAQRHITRPLPAEADMQDERHIPLSEAEFIHKRDAGLFALHWHSHGLYYGISTTIDDALTQGHMVLVNGSRAYLPEALHRYPNLLPVLIEARIDVLRERLHGRGREHGVDLEERLHGAALPIQDVPCVRIDNSGALEDALNTLRILICGYDV